MQGPNHPTARGMAAKPGKRAKVVMAELIPAIHV
jgi:hypothetical protein